jgi:hypothetical protein
MLMRDELAELETKYGKIESEPSIVSAVVVVEEPEVLEEEKVDSQHSEE